MILELENYSTPSDTFMTQLIYDFKNANSVSIVWLLREKIDCIFSNKRTF